MRRAAVIMLLSLTSIGFAGREVLLEAERAARAAQDRRAPVRAVTRGDHPAIGPGARGCATCHSRETSHRLMHGPAAAGACETCHVTVTTNGRRTIALASGARRGDTKRLCVTCHQDASGRMSNAHTHAPVAAGDCTSCHDPHGSRSRYFLPAEGNAVCLTCHVDVAEAIGQEFRHGPAVASCTLCHDPHASKFTAQLRDTVNAVCLACHVEAASDDTPADHQRLFGRAVAAHEGPLIASAPRIALDATRRAGHPSIGHPVEGRVDPVAKGRALSCASCHNPHGSTGRKLLRFGATGVSSLCIRCHQF